MRALRPVILALVFVVLLDAALYLPAARRAPRDIRIPKVSTQGLDEQADAMSVDNAVSIAVIGDSVVQGLFATRDQTAPFYLDRIYHKAGRPVRAYNLGMSAAHGLELLAATDRAVKVGKADVVVLTFNYAFYRETTTSPRYPWLYDDRSWVGTAGADPAVMRAVAAAEASKTLETRADKLVSSVWRFYRTRGYWSAALFDDPPAKVIGDAEGTWRDKVARRYQAPRKLKPNELDGDKVRGMFDVADFSSSNDNVRLFLESVERAKASGAHVIVVVTPINKTGLRYHHALDEAKFARNLAWLQTQSEQRGAQFVDLSAGFPDQLIADSVHPLPAGYEKMAQLIAARIEPAVRQAEAKREANR